jgi:hypothetical protein
MQIGNKPKNHTRIYCQYGPSYEPIYDNSYGIAFVFVDEEELDSDSTFYPALPPALVSMPEEVH